MTNTNLNRKIYLFLSTIFLMCFLVSSTYAQQNRKIQIVLLGTFHLTPSDQDLYKNKKIDLHSPAKKQEIQEIVNRLAAFNPSQICLEYPMEDQLEMDSIYSAYKIGKYQLADNERDLFGFQAVKKLGLKSPTCINYSLGKFDADTVRNFAMQNSQKNIFDSFQTAAQDFLNEMDDNLEALTLRNFLLYCNTDDALQKNLRLYTKYFAKIGEDSNYVGADLVADWYSTNIHIYTNILRSVKPTDKRILVLFGQGHIPILKHLFENNPDFEVIEVKEILK